MRTLLTITLLCQSLHLLAQPANLVPNGGFEEYKKCAGDWSGIQIVGAPTQSVEHWFRPTNGTPDYFNACSNTEQTELPTNLIGHTEPKDGQACAGILVYHSEEFDEYDYNYREYLCVRLRTPMVAGHTYCVGMYATPAERLNVRTYSHPMTYNIFAVRSLGMFFSNTLVLDTVGASSWYISTGINTLPVEPQIVATEIMADTNRWYLITANYVAQGGEEWLTIGNFEQDTTTLSESIMIREGVNPERTLASYYFIDRVFAYDLEGPSPSVFAKYPTTWCTLDFPDTLRTMYPVKAAVWSTGDTYTDAIEVNNTGWYTIQGTIDGCPVVHDSVEVTNESPLEVLIDGPRLIENCGDTGIPQPVILRSTVPLPNYTWQINPWYQRFDSTTIVTDPYMIALSSSNVCGTFRDSVQVLGCKPGPLYIPNVFAPDAGNDNAFFNVFGNNILVQELQVFDVWGQRVYHAIGDLGQGWDGTTTDGQDCPPGVYMWVLRYNTWTLKASKILRGDVTLIR
jgi:hypothetical protein